MHAVVYTDEATAYTTLANRHAVKHGVGEWVRDQIHINGMESFWSMLKRAHMGTYAGAVVSPLRFSLDMICDLLLEFPYITSPSLRPATLGALQPGGWTPTPCILPPQETVS